MEPQFWHNLVVEKSFVFLQELRKHFQFVLIGGWAVYFYTNALKSKDIDIIVEFEELEKLKMQFPLIKNERLRKYEIKAQGFDVDIYLPYFSQLGLPLDFVMAHTVLLKGFQLPKKEILLALKLLVYTKRKASLKGKKDMIDIISLLYHGRASISELQSILIAHRQDELLDVLGSLLKEIYEVKEVGLHRKAFADLKKSILNQIYGK